VEAKLKTKFVQFAVVIGTLFILGAAQANADSVLSFEGLKDNEPVLNYYNGGLGGMGSGPSSNFGIVFSANSLAILEDEAGGSGNFAGEPSASTVVYFLSGGADTMNVAAGFTTGFSFFYSADNNPGSITVWDGLNGTGNKLATLSLPTNPNPNCTIDPGSGFCNWTAIGVSFSGTAESVDFGGSANQIGFDNITLGSSTPETVPEPSSLLLLGLTAAGILGAMKKKFLVAL
jgi:hypothetical protein